MHGAGCTPDVFAAQLAAFPDALAPDLHALAPDAATVAEYAEVLNAVLADIVGPFALVGSSMGAAVALEAALTGPTPSALIAIGCGPKLRVAPQILAAIENDFEGFVATMPPAFFAAPTPALAGEAVRQLRAVGQTRTLADFRACDIWDIGDRASTLALQALVLTGEHDLLTPARFGQSLANRIPGGEMRILTDAGHLAMAERPAETNDALRAFVVTS